MCGIVAILDPNCSADEWVSILGRMVQRLEHRGPDEQGIWFDRAAAIGLGHTRLAILDPTPRAQQPMVSTSGRYRLSYNGEVFNYREIRKQLEGRGRVVSSSGDTEVVLGAIEAWGLVESLRRFNGMFALALWDDKKRKLHLVRDRFGEKPLFWCQIGRSVVATSELKAMCVHPKWIGSIDRRALADYFRYRFIPSPTSIYEGVFKVDPGSIVTFDAADPTQAPTTERYWSLPTTAKGGKTSQFSRPIEDLVDELESHLWGAVQRRMASDAPAGAFLSGGVDSSIIAAIMAKTSSQTVQTFSVGFRESDYDETPWAKAIGDYLGTDHRSLIVTAEEARGVLPDLPRIYDEPFGDVSQIPTVLLSRFARQQVKVCLSGEGGDEAFAGYKRYRLARDLWRVFSRVPLPIRSGLAGLLNSSPGWLLDSAFAWSDVWQSHYGRRGQTRHKIQRLAPVLESPNADSLYRNLWTLSPPAAHWVLGTEGRRTPREQGSHGSTLAFEERMMLSDLQCYLPDDLLVKLDRASMSVGLEARVPMLDHELLEFVLQLPLTTKTRGSKGKWILREVLARHLPKQLFDRPKMGFGVPIAAWLRGPLRDWAEPLLGEGRLEDDQFLDPRVVRRMWSEHLAQQRDWSAQLWTVLMFHGWLDESRTRSE